MQWSAILEVSDYWNFYIAVIGWGVVVLSLNRCW